MTPNELLLPQLCRSASHYAAVGIRYPTGQGLFTPLTPCHRLLFCGLRQSFGELGARIKLPCDGVSVVLKVDIVDEFRF